MPGKPAISSSALRLLIVDARRDRRRATARMLPGGWQVFQAESAEVALDMVCEGRPHCVFVAAVLPGEDAIGFVRAATQVPGAHATAVVVTSDHADEQLRIRAMRAGAMDMLVSGALDGDTLRRTLEFAVERAALCEQVERQRRELERLATTDELTGLYNRRHLMERLQQEVRRSKRYESGLCLLLLDIDHFKGINDTHGHPTGDQVLVEVAETIQRCIRDTDVAGRLGGDEMAVVLVESRIGAAEAVGRRIRAGIEAICVPGKDGLPIRVTSSIGVCEMGRNHATAEDLYKGTDTLLYDAKLAGRNCVQPLPAIPSLKTLARARRARRVAATS